MAGAQELTRKYDSAAPRWADKMRLLGYYDAYLGLLTSRTFRAPRGNRMLDVGCGTGAFAEAWVAIQGVDQDVTLLDPVPAMLTQAQAALQGRGVTPDLAPAALDDFEPDTPFHCLLAAHVLEHAHDPVAMLVRLRALAQPDGRLWLVVSKPHWCNAIIWLQWRHRAYRPDDVARMLADAGWALEMDYAFPSGPPSRTSHGYLARAV